MAKENVKTVQIGESLLKRVRKASALYRYTIRDIVETGTALRLAELKDAHMYVDRKYLGSAKEGST